MQLKFSSNLLVAFGVIASIHSVTATPVARDVASASTLSPITPEFLAADKLRWETKYVWDATTNTTALNPAHKERTVPFPIDIKDPKATIGKRTPLNYPSGAECRISFEHNTFNFDPWSTNFVKVMNHKNPNEVYAIMASKGNGGWKEYPFDGKRSFWGNAFYPSWWESGFESALGSINGRWNDRNFINGPYCWSGFGKTTYGSNQWMKWGRKFEISFCAGVVAVVHYLDLVDTILHGVASPTGPVPDIVRKIIC